MVLSFFKLLNVGAKIVMRHFNRILITSRIPFELQRFDSTKVFRTCNFQLIFFLNFACETFYLHVDLQWYWNKLHVKLGLTTRNTASMTKPVIKTWNLSSLNRPWSSACTNMLSQSIFLLLDFRPFVHDNGSFGRSLAEKLQLKFSDFK
jgi:hypothetical protein